MFTYTILTYYNEDPCESWEQTFANPVHIGENIEIEVDGFEDVEYEVFLVLHSEKGSQLLCSYADAISEEGMHELRKALRIRSTERK